MSPPSDHQPLLSSSPSGTYGTVHPHSRDDGSRPNTPTPIPTPSSDTQSLSDTTKVGGSEKVHKKFREIWALCLGLWTAVFCSALGTTIVSNIQLEISSQFRAGSLASWLGTAFLLGLTAITPLYGRLAQVLGRKGAMLLAVSFFFTGTLMCAIAPSMPFILFARAIAGAGSGGLLTVTAIILSDLVSIADRGLYQGGANVLFGAGAASGAVLGGAVADQLGWRMAFWMQLPPIALATALIITQVHVPHVPSELSAWQKTCRIDWAGSVVLVTSISSLSIASSLFTSSGYPLSHPLVWGLFLVCLLTIPIFIYVEKKAIEPILPLAMLTRLQPSLVLVGFVLTTATNFGRMYMQPVYLHVTRGLNGSQTGLVLLPSSIVGSASSLYAGWHMSHYKEYKSFQAVMSVIPWIQALSIMVGWGPETSLNRLWLEMAVGALGGGATITTLLTALIACVEPSELSLAISACYLFRAIGQVIGVAIAAAIQQSILLNQLTTRLADYPPDLVRSIIQEPARVIPTLEPFVQLQARLSYLVSIEGVFGFVVAGGVCLTVICVSLRAQPL